MAHATQTSPQPAAPPGDPERSRARSRRGRLATLFTGHPNDPRWARPALWAILALAAVLYLWNLSAVGQANSFYSAAVYSGTQSWKALFFGSLDAGDGGFITVDKPPFALWVMGLSCRVFGFGTWQMMLPMAAAGVGAVALLYRMVRGSFGHIAATVAALVLALTPMTVAITRDNNPDPVLVLLMLLGAAGTLRAIRTGTLLPLVWAAVAIGFGFNTKMLQAYIVLPAFFLAYLVAARTGLGKRIAHLAVAAVALVVSSGWWMFIVDRVPSGSRPYIGGSTDNSVWDLVIGYNGFGRIFGASGGGGGGQGGGFGGEAGIGRMFNEIVGGQISWLIPFALLALGAGLVLRGRRPRTDVQRASLLLWGGWLVLHYLVFSLSEGTFHPYYVTAMAPAIAALSGAGSVALIRAARRRGGVWPWLPPVAVAGTAVWAIVLLARTDGWNSWLMPLIGVAAVVAVAALVAQHFGGLGQFGGVGRLVRRRRLMAVAVLAAAVAMLAGPSAYAVSATASQGGGMNGTNPTAGPSTGNSMGGPGGGGPGGGGGKGGPPGGSAQGKPSTGQAPNGQASGGSSQGGKAQGAQAPGGQAPGGSGQKGQSGQQGAPGKSGQSSTSGKGSTSGGSQRGGGGAGGPGGSVSTEMVSYLKKHQDGATWLVAVANDQSASTIILESGRPVISMGGWSGSDDAMTLTKLKQLVKDGKLHYIMLGSSGGPGGNSKTDITQWVKENGSEVSSSAYSSGSSSGSDPSSSGSPGSSSNQLYRLDASDVD